MPTDFLPPADSGLEGLGGELIRLLFEESPWPKSLEDEQFRVIRVNRAYCDLLGQTPEALLGHDSIEWLASADRLVVQEQRRRLGQGEALPTTQLRELICRDGSSRWCRIIRNAVHTTAGARVDLCTLHDETDEIRNQQLLRAYWQRFERFFELAPVGLMISDGTGNVSVVNRQLEEIVGRPRERLVGRPDVLGQVSTDGRWRPDGLQRVILTHDDGSTRWIDTVARQLEDLDGRPMRLTVVHDVTREHTLSDNLVESQWRFHQFAQAVEDAIFVVTPGLEQALYANGRFEPVFGVSRSAFMSRPRILLEHFSASQREELMALFSPADSEETRERVLEIEAPESVRAVRVRVFPFAGSDPVVSSSSAPASDVRRVARLFVMAEDITETLRLEQARLEAALKQRDMLVREVHHRIKNNLQGVAGLLQQSATSRPELAESLVEVVGRIQAIAQVHGLQVQDSDSLVARRVIAAVFENLGRMFGVSIPVQIESDSIDRWLLPEQEAVPLALVVNELGTNAIKHRVPNAAVFVRLGALPDGLVLEIQHRGSLPEAFDFDRLEPGPSGLGLVRALLPRRGARLDYLSQGDQIIARAELTRPALRERGAEVREKVRLRG